MVAEVESARKREHRTRSELVREALRTYFAVGASIPVAVATAAERRALVRGRDGIRRGEFVSLHDLKNDLDSRPRRRRK
jgi:hypothetical protein